jgi:hypothetical protein
MCIDMTSRSQFPVGMFSGFLQVHRHDFKKQGLWLFKFNSKQVYKDYVPGLAARLADMDKATLPGKKVKSPATRDRGSGGVQRIIITIIIVMIMMMIIILLLIRQCWRFSSIEYETFRPLLQRYNTSDVQPYTESSINILLRVVEKGRGGGRGIEEKIIDTRPQQADKMT